MSKLRLVVLIMTIIISGGVFSQAARADSVLNRPLTVILADRQALAEHSGGLDVAKSLVGLLSHLSEGQLFAFISADKTSEVIGPARAGEAEFKTFQQQVDASLASSESAKGADLVSALEQTHIFLSESQAKPGSKVYLVTGGSFKGDLAKVSDRLALTIGKFEESKWPIVGLGLPGQSPETAEFLSRASAGSGGDVFMLSVPDGFKSLTERVLSSEAKGALAQVGNGVLSPNDVLTSVLDIAPGTREATLLFFRQAAYGSLRLSNPSGFEASAGDRAVSSVVEMPHVVIWRLVEPVPGQWKVDARGAAGVVSAWRLALNKYSVALASFDTIPVNEPAALVAFVTDGYDKVTLQGVKLVAKVTNPSGTTFLHELNDDGAAGDAIAGDGFYSASIPPVGVDGKYSVELELAWAGSEHRVTSLAEFSAQPFPAIEFTAVATQDIRPGEKTKVATALVHVKGQPYPISISDITSQLAFDGKERGVIELAPQRLLEAGRAWSFDVYFTPAQEGLHTVLLALSMKYAGREFTYTSDSMVLSAVVPPPPPPQPVVEVVVPKPAPAPEPAAVVEKSPLIPDFPRSLLAIPAVVAGLAALAMYWFSRTKPYGYLYTDRNELVADFRRLRRNPIMSLLSRNAIDGKELRAAGLERVKFKFVGSRVDVNSAQTTPTIRVNNQPLIHQTPIYDRTWIGAAGRLYSFLLSPPAPPQARHAGGDD